MAIAKDVRRIKDEHQKMNSKASVQNACRAPDERTHIKVVFKLSTLICVSFYKLGNIYWRLRPLLNAGEPERES